MWEPTADICAGVSVIRTVSEDAVVTTVASDVSTSASFRNTVVPATSFLKK